MVSKCRIMLKWKQKKAHFNRQKKTYYATKISIFTELSKIFLVRLFIMQQVKTTFILVTVLSLYACN